ncbi:unnamed protein product, partial [Polarella glacialis]
AAPPLAGSPAGSPPRLLRGVFLNSALAQHSENNSSNNNRTTKTTTKTTTTTAEPQATTTAAAGRRAELWLHGQLPLRGSALPRLLDPGPGAEVFTCTLEHLEKHVEENTAASSLPEESTDDCPCQRYPTIPTSGFNNNNINNKTTKHPILIRKTRFNNNNNSSFNNNSSSNNSNDNNNHNNNHSNNNSNNNNNENTNSENSHSNSGLDWFCLEHLSSRGSFRLQAAKSPEKLQALREAGSP